VKKFLLMSKLAEKSLGLSNKEKSVCTVMEFDDMETFEHTKCKPISITLAVEQSTRRILGIRASRMPAKGHLTKISVKKYGKRKDERPKARDELFSSINGLICKKALIKSDENPHYRDLVKRHFPNSKHEVFKGQRGCIVGQGELKKLRFDPLFSLNHTCAMIRANINRLFRKTWCTTKCLDRLQAHLNLFADFHNEFLIAKN